MHADTLVRHDIAMNEGERAARDSIKRAEMVAIRVLYFLAMTAIVALYPLTKLHMQTLAFVFIFVITGVMLFFTIVKLEVAGVAQNASGRHRDRVFYIAVIHWLIYGTLYYFTDVDIGIGWVAFALQFVSAALYVMTLVGKSTLDRLMEKHKMSPWTMRTVVGTLYAYNVIIMLPIEDNNVLTAPIYVTLPRYILFLVTYVLYVAYYRPYVSPTPGVLLTTYITNTCVLYMNFYILTVVGFVSIVYHGAALIHRNRDSILSVLQQDFRAIVELDGQGYGVSETDNEFDHTNELIDDSLRYTTSGTAAGESHPDDLLEDDLSAEDDMVL